MAEQQPVAETPDRVRELELAADAGRFGKRVNHAPQATRGVRAFRAGKYFPFITFRRLIAHTRLTLFLLQSARYLQQPVQEPARGVWRGGVVGGAGVQRGEGADQLTRG